MIKIIVTVTDVPERNSFLIGTESEADNPTEDEGQMAGMIRAVVMALTDPDTPEEIGLALRIIGAAQAAKELESLKGKG